MRKIAEQLFINDAKLKREIEKLQGGSDTPKNRELIDAKHEEWDRTKHLIDLFFNSVGL